MPASPPESTVFAMPARPSRKWRTAERGQRSPILTLGAIVFPGPAGDDERRKSGPAGSCRAPGYRPKNRGDAIMTKARHVLATLAAAALLAAPALLRAETIRIGLPTKTYWPTTVAEAAKAQKLFEKEGITAELTIYRGGAETFEALAAGAADLILDAPSLPAAGRKKGVMSKVVANGSMGDFGWRLMVLTKSPLDVKDQRQEGRHHLGGLGLGPAGVVDDPEQKDRFHPRAGRRRWAGAQSARRQYRRGRGVFAAELPDREVRRGQDHPRLRQGSAAEPHLGLDRHRQIRAGKACGGAESAQCALWRADVHAQQPRGGDQADRRSLRNAGRYRCCGIREHHPQARHLG